jgi:PAS domain S-box-containing protein
MAFALVTFVCFRLRLNLVTAACLYLIIIVLLSLEGSFLLSALLSLIGVGCLMYYFASPIFSFWISDPLNAAAIIAFLTTSAVITRLVSRVRKSAEELRRREAYLAEAQKLSHTGTFGWRVSTGENLWSDETFRIFQYDRTTQPTAELVLRRVHPEDAAQVKQTMERASRDGMNFEHEYRLVMPDGTVKYVHVVAHALTDDANGNEFVGAVMDVTGARQLEAALQTSEQQWRDVFENNPTMYFMIGAAGTIMAVNLFGAEQLGYTVDELIGHPVSEVFYEPDREPAQRNVARCLKQLGKSMSWELRKVRKDRSMLWVRETARAVLRAGEPVVLIACEDITERKNAEDKIREQEMEFRQIVNLTPLHVAVLGPDRSALYLNQTALDYHGLTLEEWRNADRLSFFHPDDRERLMTEHKAKFLRGHPFQTEVRLRRNDGKYRWFLFHMNPLRDEHAHIKRWYIAATDIEDRKQAEEKLQRSEAHLAEAQRLTHTGSWAWRVAGRDALHLSEEWYRIYGFDPENGPPAFEERLQRTHPEDRPKWLGAIDRAIAEKSDYEVEFRILLPDGSVRHIHTVGHPVLNTSGDLAQFVGSATDITQRKLGEEALRQARADLAHVSRVTTMGELTASLAHEVNQPIAAAVTNANTCLRWLTRDQPDLDEAREAATRIVKDGTRAAEIIKRIRMVFTKDTPEWELVDLNDVIREMIVLLRSETTRHSISIRTELNADLPAVMGDRVQLQQVMMNLIMNSIDAMNDVAGPRELTIKSQRAEGGHPMVSVSDTGVGLPPQQADQIFKAFFTTKLDGTGMGLSISRSIIESHGGRLWAASNSPQGSCFYLILPSRIEARQ